VLLELFRIPSTDYKRFMNFLATHDCRPDFREFRNPRNHQERPIRAAFPQFPPLMLEGEPHIAAADVFEKIAV
jgi:hypothetical protein